MPGQIEYAPLDELYLDARNPRLGRVTRAKIHSPEEIYDQMGNWSLEELATSFLESRFWVHEAVLCAEEKIDGQNRLVVIEGNRRIAALMRLKKTFDGEEPSRKWLELVHGVARPDELFERIPFIRLETRGDVDAFLGFRHVTGIKEWAPPEKAEFIAKLIEENGLTYREVMRKIGSRTDVVERNYIAFCILSQMEETEGLETVEVEKRFSVLFLSLRSRSVQRFLGIEDKFGGFPSEVRPPVDTGHVSQLREYSLWLFGNAATPAVVKDSRDVEKFARVLASQDALEYMRHVRRPDLEKAFVISGGDKEEIYELILTAAYNLQEALSSIHLYKDDDKLISISKRLVANAEQIKKTLELS